MIGNACGCVGHVVDQFQSVEAKVTSTLWDGTVFTTTLSLSNVKTPPPSSSPTPPAPSPATAAVKH